MTSFSGGIFRFDIDSRFVSEEITVYSKRNLDRSVFLQGFNHSLWVIVWNVFNTLGENWIECDIWVLTWAKICAYWSFIFYLAYIIRLTWASIHDTNSFEWPAFFIGNTNFNSELSCFIHISSVASSSVSTRGGTFNNRIWGILNESSWIVLSSINSVFTESVTETSNSWISPARTTLSLIKNVWTTIGIFTIEIIMIYIVIWGISTGMSTILFHPFCVISSTFSFSIFTNSSRSYVLIRWFFAFTTCFFAIVNIWFKPWCRAILFVFWAPLVFISTIITRIHSFKHTHI